MDQNIEDENLMERYLLGVSSTEEASRLEERSLADYDFFERILVVENRLIDDYLTGQLAPPQRAQFEQSFLSSPKRRERVEFARTFLGLMAQKPASAVAPVLDPAASPTRGLTAEKSLWRDRWQTFFGFNNWGFGLAAAAALLLLGLAGWSFLETRRVREELAQLNRERAAAERREQELQARLSSQQGQTEELRQELERSRIELERLRAKEAKLRQTQAQSSLTAVASITLMPPRLRGGSPDRVPSLIINPNTDSARLTLVVDKELIAALLASYPRVRAELSGGGKIQPDLKPRRVNAGRAFVVTLPAANLSEGGYQIRLVGSGAAGETVIADYSFKVEKK